MEAQKAPGVQLLNERVIRVGKYTGLAKEILSQIEISTEPQAITHLADSIFGVIGLLVANRQASQEVMLIGNGGSAAIASEVANRFWKFCGLKARTFNDPVMLTATANDYGWQSVFAKPIEVHARADDVLFAISSSGQSANILNAVRAALAKECRVITLSGFARDNPLRSLGHFNFYVPSDSYRHVERTHLFVLDCIHDLFLEVNCGKINMEGRRLVNE